MALAKARTPEAIEQVLRRLPRKWGRGIREADRQWFDELMGAVAREYTILAPWSSAFEPRALDAILDKLSAIHEVVSDNGRKLDKLLGGGARPGRVLFGGRPYVAAGFVERGEQQRLRNLVIDGAQERTVLVGMAGCGKSQLASCLARECGAAEWGLVAWINSSSKDSVRSDLVELARRLGVDMGDNPTEDQAVQRCLDHLQSAKAGDRLVVFDNVEDFGDLAGWVPEGAGLRVVATARSREASSAWEPVEVGVLPRPDSINLVQKITGSQDDGAADALAERLGDLPLALAQAVETARIERWTLAECLAQLDAYASDRVIHRIPDDSYADDVSTALLMAAYSALGRIEGSLRDTARRQLGALAVLAESGVPTHWLAPRADADKTYRDANARDEAADNARCALTALLNASVVQQTADGGVTMLHRLQAQVLCENWNEDERAEAFDAAERTLTTARTSLNFPIPDPPWTRNEKIDDYLESMLKEESETILQLTAIATQAHSQSLFKREEIQELTICLLKESTLLHSGFDMSSTITAMIEQLTWDDTATIRAAHALADTLLYEPADVRRAIEFLKKALQHAIKFEQFPSLAINIRFSLAVAYENTEQYADAIKVLKENFDQIKTRAIGTSADDTVDYVAELPQCASRLAMLYNGTHKHEAAISLLEDVCELIGSDKTLLKDGIVVPLAVAYAQRGDKEKALSLLQPLLSACDNPLQAFLYLRDSGLFAFDGYDEVRIPLFEAVLQKHIDFWSEEEDCPSPSYTPLKDTQTALDEAYSQAGSGRSSVQLFQRHYDTVQRNDATFKQACIARHMLAAAHYHSHNIAQSLELAEENYTVCKLAFGSQSMQLDYAEELLVRVYEANSGTKDLRTLESQNNYAMTLARHSDFRVAKSLLEATLKAGEYTLSPDHPLTVQIRKNLKAVEHEMNQSRASSPESSDE